MKRSSRCGREGIWVGKIPIFKSGDLNKITSYKPNSVLSFFSMIFERVMYNHISDFIESLNVLYK